MYYNPLFLLTALPKLLYLKFLIFLAYRLKPSQLFPSTIIEICTSLFACAFEGDIFVTYGPALAKDSDNSSKPQIAHVDLIGRLGQTKITANVTNKQIQTHLLKPLPSSSVCLSDFTIRKRGQFERGDAEYCLLITARTYPNHWKSL